MEHQPTLQRLVANRLAELDLSARAAATKAGISHTTVAGIASGAYRGRPSDPTLRGLAIALDLPISRILSAVDREVLDSEWVLPGRFRALNGEARAEVERFADTLLRWQRRYEAVLDADGD